MNFKVLKDVGILGVGQYLPKLAVFAVMPFITPYLTKADYGVYGVVMSYIAFFEAFLTMGFLITFSNTYFKHSHHYQWIWRQLYGFLSIWSVGFALLLAGILYLAIPGEAATDRLHIILFMVIPYAIFGPSHEIGNTLSVYSKNYTPVAIASILFGVLGVGLTYYFVAILRLGYMGWFYSLGIVAFCTRLYWAVYLQIIKKLKPIFNFKKRVVKEAFRVGLPVIPHVNGGYLLGQSDRVIMSMLNVATAQIGSYNAAYTIANIVETINSSFMMIIQPITFGHLKEKNFKELQKIFFATQFVYYIGVAFFACYAQEIVKLLFRNEELHDIYPLVVLLVIALASKPIYAASSLPYFYNENTKIVSLYTLVAGLLNVGLNFVFIPYFGVYGAATTTIIAYVILSYSRLFIPQFKTVFRENMYPAFWIIVYGGISILSYLLCFEDLMLRIAVSVGVLLLPVVVYFLFLKLNRAQKI